MSVKIRYRKLSDGASRPYLDIYHEGRRIKESVDIILFHGDQHRKEKLKMLDSLRSKKEMELFKQELDFDKNKNSRINFIEYYAKFLENYKRQDVRLVKCSFVKFKLFIKTDTFPITQLTPEVCDAFARFLQDPKNGLRGETVHNYFRKFKSVVYRLVQEDILKTNPTKGVSTGRVQNQLTKNVLTEEELKMLAQTPVANIEVKKAFLFACYSGLGYAELVQMKWRNIQNGKLIIAREKTGEQVIIDLHPVCLTILGKEHQNINDPVFDLPSNTTVAKWLRRWVKDAGIKKHITFYCGRHIYATQLLLKGANLKTVADCMGQRTTVQTMRYLNYVDTLKTEAISRLPSLDLEF